MAALICAAHPAGAQPPWGGFANHGLVGVGRIPADTFDRYGGGHQDTLGGVFSAMTLGASTGQWRNGGVTGLLLGQPDRGFGNGDQDYHPRLEIFAFWIRPVSPSANPAPGTAFPQDQITLVNVATQLYLDSTGNPFTGYDADDATQLRYPQAIVPATLAGATPGVHRSLDAEGIALAKDGTHFTSDEYGPFIYHFNAAGRLIGTIVPPAAFLPKRGSVYPRTTNFTANTDPDSGRRSNRGFEGLGVTPDGSKLVAMLQSPLIQDGGASSASQNTRICVFEARSGALVHEYVYPLTLNNYGANTPVSELMALNEHQFLVLERDNLGRGSGNAKVPAYKEIVLVDTDGATDLAGSGYDLELGAPGQRSLPTRAADLAAVGVKAVMRQDFINLLDTTGLARFGLNVKADPESDQNSITEKWEGLALIPLRDRRAPDDFLLLVGNDNDFKAAKVYHNGVVVGQNAETLDSLVLAYRVTLPGAFTVCP